MSTALLLVNLGTPDSPSVAAVRRYLRQFLSDKRVVTLPWLLRQLLVYGFIVPFRSYKSAKAYLTIWTTRGSPLLIHTEDLRNKVQQLAVNNVKVFIGMRYGNPAIADVLDRIMLSGCNDLVVLPLYPQYSSAVNGSVLEEILKYLAKATVIPTLRIIPEFYQHELYIEAMCRLIEDHASNYDHLVFSYHGLPEKQVLTTCQQDAICQGACEVKQDCYRSKCFITTKLIAEKLNLASSEYSVAFQSRLGKMPWLQPYLLEHLSELHNRGVRNIAIVTPGFIADCLETIEEIGMQAKDYWQVLGGTSFTRVPCLNNNPFWAEALLQMTSLAKVSS